MTNTGRLQKEWGSQHRMYANDVDIAHKEFVELGVNIVDEIENKPWGHRQCTIKELDGNVFYIHHNVPSKYP